MVIERVQDPELIEKEIWGLRETFSDLIEHVDIREYSRKVAEHANVYIMKEEGTCGLEAIYMNDREHGTAYVTLFGISTAYRRKHLGTELFDHCIQEAVACGMRQLKLEVRKDNDAALSFYRREGLILLGDSDEEHYYMGKKIVGKEKDAIDGIEVSIICLTYNQEKYIRDTLDGFLIQQTDFNYEILVHDDVSTDGTVDILKEYQQKYPDKIRLILEEENQYSKGIDLTKDICFPLVRGRYIAFCEGDDYWTYQGKLQAQYDIMEADSEISMCYHNAVVYNEEKDRLTLNVLNHPSGYIKDKEVICPVKGWYPTASCFYRAEYLRDYPNLHAPTGDEGMRYYMACRGKLYFINQAWCVYREASDGGWNTKFKKDKELAERYVKNLVTFLIHFNEYSGGEYQKYFYIRLIRTILYYIEVYGKKQYTVEEFYCYIEKLKELTEHRMDGLFDEIRHIEVIRCKDYFSRTIKEKIRPMLNSDSKVYVYGAGIKASQALAELGMAQISVSGLIVTDKKKNENIVFEYPIYEFKNFKVDDNAIVWPCMLAERQEVIHSLEKAGVNNIIF